MKWMAIILLTLGMMSCGPNKKYSGDGVLTRSHGLLFNPVHHIEMPKLDVSKPQIKKYDLSGLPSSEAFYGVALVVPSLGEITPSDRDGWGVGRFTVKKGGRLIQTSSSKFSKMINNLSRESLWLNGLYIGGFRFVVDDDQDHWELIFECSGFDSPEPVWAYVLLRSGGK